MINIYIYFIYIPNNALNLIQCRQEVVRGTYCFNYFLSKFKPFYFEFKKSIFLKVITNMVLNLISKEFKAKK